jgi:hypothetical protein
VVARKNEVPFSRFQYSVVVGITGFGGIFGTSEYLSIRYLPDVQRFFALLFFYFLSFVSSGMLLSLLFEGSRFFDFPKKKQEQIGNLSRSLFDMGVCMAALFLPFYTISYGIRLIGKFLFPDSAMITDIFFYFGLSLAALIMWRRLKRYSWLLEGFRKGFDTKVLFVITLISCFVVAISLENSYDITIQTEVFMLNGERTCFITVKATGFASVDRKDPELRIYSCQTENLKGKFTLNMIDSSHFFARIPLSELGNGLYCVEFNSGKFIERRLLVLDDS